MKIVVSVLVLLAIAGIFIYKTASAKTDGSSNTSPKQDAAFAFAQSGPAPPPWPNLSHRLSRRRMRRLRMWQRPARR